VHELPLNSVKLNQYSKLTTQHCPETLPNHPAVNHLRSKPQRSDLSETLVPRTSTLAPEQNPLFLDAQHLVARSSTATKAAKTARKKRKSFALEYLTDKPFRFSRLQ
jgi:hypothetical protein